ncbi:MAG TPA: type II toxin-antitoxin system VapB family antitoxin [Acidimicrobiales bacterium]|nr:type II toxin-antitoxin system VapB family antitoxin [Acidimicrobiales bacterium]
MALSIKSDEADRLARELVQLTGETLTDAVTEALRERVQRKRPEPKDPHAVLARLQAEFAANRTDDKRTDDEILGYDEFGLPS